jgi:hypothetical protein
MLGNHHYTSFGFEISSQNTQLPQSFPGTLRLLKFLREEEDVADISQEIDARKNRTTGERTTRKI